MRAMTQRTSNKSSLLIHCCCCYILFWSSSFHTAFTLASSSSISAAAPFDATCPGSSAWTHAKCKMTVRFQQPCSTVISEINLRLTSPTWIDPHNRGTYSQISSTPMSPEHVLIKGSRLTGDGKYTDLFTFYTTDLNESGSCEVHACSESQVFSILDFSTNYCNLRNLYCNSDEGCPPVQYDLDYEEIYVDCRQNKKQNCIAKVSSG